MATISQARLALADAVGATLELPRALPAWVNPQPLSAYIVPSLDSDYVTFDDSTFCRPRYALSALVLGPLSSNPAKASEWLDENVVALAPSIGAGDPTLGGVVSNVMVRSIDRPGVTLVENGPAVLAIEIRFAPLFLAS